MRTRTWLLAVMALSFHITGCVATSTPQRSPLVRPTVIDAEELRGTDASNVYDAIARLRPAFFATRGATSILAEPSEPIVVIINRSIRGGVGELRGIESSNVRSIRRLTAAEVFSITGRSASSADDAFPPDVAERHDYYLYEGGYEKLGKKKPARTR